MLSNRDACLALQEVGGCRGEGRGEGEGGEGRWGQKPATPCRPELWLQGHGDRSTGTLQVPLSDNDFPWLKTFLGLEVGELEGSAGLCPPAPEEGSPRDASCVDSKASCLAIGM